MLFWKFRAPSADSRCSKVNTWNNIRRNIASPPRARRFMQSASWRRTAGTGIVIVDQHCGARTPRLRASQARAPHRWGIAPAPPLIPEAVDLDPVDADRVVNVGLKSSKSSASWSSLLDRGRFSRAREVPSALAGGRIKALVQDVADALAEWGAAVHQPG